MIPFFTSIHPFAKKALCLQVLLCVAFSCLSAQRPAVLVRKGEQAMQVQDYYTALHYFQQALAAKPAPDIRFREDETFDEVSRIDQLLHSEKVRRDVEKK